jgi:hypothetical protein
MSDNPIISVDKKTWYKWSLYLNVVLFIIIALFIYLLIKDSIIVGMSNEVNAWFAVIRDIAFLAVGLALIFVQMFMYYRQLSRRSW